MSGDRKPPANPADAIQAAHPGQEAQAVAALVGASPGKWSEARSGKTSTGWAIVCRWLHRVAKDRDGPVTMRATVKPDGTVAVVVEG
jgi:hypothetical protein